MKKNTLLILFVFLVCPPAASAFDHEHTTFDALLKKHVIMSRNGLESKVNYSDFKKDRVTFNKYLLSLSSVTENEFYSWTVNKRLSFLINAYNAFTIDLIIKYYPVTSIKKIGLPMQSPWKIKFIKIFGKVISLDEIEHGIIRKKSVYDEPRIHFTLVCASIGCPALQNKAFTYERLERMLEQGLLNFLSDKTRNRYNHGKKAFEISKIFKWYGEDFNKKYGSVTKFLNIYSKNLVNNEKELPHAEKAASIKFLDYNWNLNDNH